MLWDYYEILQDCQIDANKDSGEIIQKHIGANKRGKNFENLIKDFLQFRYVYNDLF